MELASNKKAYFDYEILETYEAGAALLGSEVKSIKQKRMILAGSFAVFRESELWLLNAQVPPFQAKNISEKYDPLRSRKLLLKKSELRELIGKTSQKGLTIVPLKVYTKHNLIKILIGLARHKKTGDKRETIKKRETEREIEREIKNR